MDIKTGVDIVYLPRFKKSLASGGASFLQRVYRPGELKDKQSLSSNKRPEHLAGIFAAKEAVMKALGLPPNSWRDIQITYKRSGAPVVKLTHHSSLVTSHSLSISHDGNYVVAAFVAVLK